MKDIQVYIFTGFLDSGKTTFIKETLSDKRFNEKEPTLLLLCEEGEVEYDTTAPHMKNVKIEYIDCQEDFNIRNLTTLASKTNASRVIIEYNGMWSLDTVYSQLPENWMIYQEVMFADSNTFSTFNDNMRNITFDKLSGCEIVIFNRCKDGFDKMALHKLVRAVNRQNDIAYEYCDGRAEYDDIEDPLPFDINADIVKIEDTDYALWYRDITEEMEKYKDKVVSFKALVAVKEDFEMNTFVAGRQVMTCCVDDIVYAGLACKCENRGDMETGDWIELTGKIEIRFNNLYGKKGPVIKVISMQKAEKPDEVVACF